MNLFNKINISRSFNRAAESYDKHAKVQKQIGIQLLSLLNLNINYGIIVDIGSGTGWLTQKTAAHFPKATMIAIDISPAMLNHAQANNSNKAINYICADADHLPLPDAFCDTIITNLMLQWSDNYQTTFSEFYRILKPNGYLLFSTFSQNTLHELRFCWQQIDKFKHIHDFTSTEELTTALKHNNFFNIKLLECSTILYDDSVINIMKSIKNIGAHNQNIDRYKGLTPKSHLKKCESYYELFRDKNNLLPITYEAILGMAQK